MKRVLCAILIVLTCIFMTGCNPVARKMGGDMTINLKPGQKLVNVTWKSASLWILTKPMTKDDKVETYLFREDSTFGILEGTVTIIEHKEDK